MEGHESGEMLTEEQIRSDYQKWDDIGKHIFECLLQEHIPIDLIACTPKRFHDRLYRMDNVLDIVNYQMGIILTKARYFDENGVFKMKWITGQDEDDMNTEKFKSMCTWILYPLRIQFTGNLLDSKMLAFTYIMRVHYADQSGNTADSEAIIQTRLNGEILHKWPLPEKEEEEFKHRFAYPKQIVSRINRCLVNNFFADLWIGPSCAAWYFTDKSFAYYLGKTQLPGEWGATKHQELIALADGPNGDAALVLLAYAFFSVLKPFFPSYPVLKRDSDYLYVKKNLPKQIAINVWSNNIRSAEKLAHICCGYFLDFTSDKTLKSSIIDGLSIQKTPSKLSSLGINEFETKMIQPACPLWINRKPNSELIREGKILDLQLKEDEDVGSGLDRSLSVNLVNFLIDEICKKIKGLSKEKGAKNVWMGEGYLEKNDKNSSRRGSHPFSLESIYKRRLVRLSRYSRVLSSQYIVIGQLDVSSEEREEKAEIEPDLGVDVVRKIAYLSAAFCVFASVAIKSQDQYIEICNKAETAIITAFKTQMQKPTVDIKDVLEDYILHCLKAGRCSRIRGVDSEKDNIHIWYDPREKIFLFPNEKYFENLKSTCPTLDISKSQFEEMLNQAKILSTAQRQNQVRKTFDVVVRKGPGPQRRMSVLKIYAERLSEHFLKKAHDFLEQMEKDATSYRS